ncbi:BON domain-containing protein [Alkalilimnicola ehrlichii]|nr:BON domain-containing protein [Alkalilimnicola ehrlichii]
MLPLNTWANDREADAALIEAVTERLDENSLTESGVLVVSAQDGVVELVGTVRSSDLLDVAEALALEVEGVEEVVNRLEVFAPEPEVSPPDPAQPPEGEPGAHQQPELQQPEAQQPEAQQPEAQQPEAQQPE